MGWRGEAALLIGVREIAGPNLRGTGVAARGEADRGRHGHRRRHGEAAHGGGEILAHAVHLRPEGAAAEEEAPAPGRPGNGSDQRAHAFRQADRGLHPGEYANGMERKKFLGLA